MSREPFAHKSRLIRYTLLSLGWVSFVCGVIGIVLPVVPTSPFLILSAACFLRSSPRFYYWLINHRWFGVYIRYYLDGKGIPRRAKIMILLMLWVMMLSSALLIVKIRWVSICMLLIAAAVTVYIARQPEPRETADH